MRPRGGLLVLALLLGACAGTPATVAPDALDDGVVARFGAARSLAADATGTLYVADAEAGAVVALSPTGDRLGVFGGPGTAGGALIDVADVDPTNGQAVFVADAGAGAVIHYTAERRAVAAIEIPEGDDTEREILDREVTLGRPVALARGPGETLYVVEAERGVVLRLDGRGAVDQVLGGGRAGALVDPVSVAVDADGMVYVADRSRRVVQTFDAFGVAGRAIPTEAVGAPVSVRIAGRRLVVAGAESVAVVDRLGGLERVVPVEASEPLVGAVLTEVGLFVLTATRLARIEDRSE
ncbi:MAG: hypothetical protein AAF845_10285 [Bacteroidota bacterium]